eukprot:scaffold1046_cov162-Ochromonas_danica.AAC.33
MHEAQVEGSLAVLEVRGLLIVGQRPHGRRIKLGMAVVIVVSKQHEGLSLPLGCAQRIERQAAPLALPGESLVTAALLNFTRRYGFVTWRGIQKRSYFLHLTWGEPRHGRGIGLTVWTHLQQAQRVGRRRRCGEEMEQMRGIELSRFKANSRIAREQVQSLQSAAFAEVFVGDVEALGPIASLSHNLEVADCCFTCGGRRRGKGRWSSTLEQHGQAMRCQDSLVEWGSPSHFPPPAPQLDCAPRVALPARSQRRGGWAARWRNTRDSESHSHPCPASRACVHNPAQRDPRADSSWPQGAAIGEDPRSLAPQRPNLQLGRRDCSDDGDVVAITQTICAVQEEDGARLVDRHEARSPEIEIAQQPGSHAVSIQRQRRIVVNKLLSGFRSNPLTGRVLQGGQVGRVDHLRVAALGDGVGREVGSEFVEWKCSLAALCDADALQEAIAHAERGFWIARERRHGLQREAFARVHGHQSAIVDADAVSNREAMLSLFVARVRRSDEPVPRRAVPQADLLPRQLRQTPQRGVGSPALSSLRCILVEDTSLMSGGGGGGGGGGAAERGEQIAEELVLLHGFEEVHVCSGQMAEDAHPNK